MQKIIECVPNFSEGVNLDTIRQITDEIEAIEGVKLLDVDPGKATNRTVVTFVGHPEAVVEAAFRAIAKAAQIIDMSQHKGEHPRMGATDVCPLIPISGVSMEEAAAYAHLLGKRVGEALNIPVYMYEAAATSPKRINLASIREGEYEGFVNKILLPEWKPDYGQAVFNKKAGATVIGARDFLVAYNVNLNTKSVRLANSIAFDVREQGRVKRIGNPITGEIAKDDKGNALRIPGVLKSVKAIGWFIEEYNIAQISMNLTNINITSVHEAFDAVEKSAQSRGVRVTGSELVGLVPLQSMLAAGRYFLKKQNRSIGVSDEELIHIAVKSLGLDELSAFDPQKKIIEYVMRAVGTKRLIDRNLQSFADETASESPAPGGGSISAYVGALGAALAAMVGNLSAGKRGWEDRVEQFSSLANACQQAKNTLIQLVDEDTNAFNQIMEAFGLPKDNDEQKQIRKRAIDAATINAIHVPYKVMQTIYAILPHIEEAAAQGNPNSVSDAGVAILCAVAGLRGAMLNIKINATGVKNNSDITALVVDALGLETNALAVQTRILKIVDEKIG